MIKLKMINLYLQFNVNIGCNNGNGIESLKPLRRAQLRWGILCSSVGWRTSKGLHIRQRYSPQKVRPEEGGERRRTSNRSVRILAELEPERRTKPSSSGDKQDPEASWRGWNQPSTFSRWRDSRSHWSWRYNRFQPVHRHRIGFIPDLKNKKLITPSENSVRVSVE